MWRSLGNPDAMILATPVLDVAYARIREITGKDVEDFDETDFLLELENRNKAILKEFGLAEDSEDEILEDDAEDEVLEDDEHV